MMVNFIGFDPVKHRDKTLEDRYVAMNTLNQYETAQIGDPSNFMSAATTATLATSTISERNCHGRRRSKRQCKGRYPS